MRQIITLKVWIISWAVIFVAAMVLIVYLDGKYEVCPLCNNPTQAPDTPAEQTSQIYRVTAYCPCKLCRGVHSDGITASGAKAEGKLIAAPRSIPFGTWIDIDGYGYAEVLDRGGAIKGRRLDILFTDDKEKGLTGHEKALEWGVKYLPITIK